MLPFGLRDRYKQGSYAARGDVHIASSLKMAGVLSFIARMCSVADDVCRTLADTFYTELTKENSPGIKRGTSIAEAHFAFHAAI